MEAERRTSKGGFFQLFDWNSKSRKKLFSNKPEVAEAEISKQGRQNATKSLDYLQLMEGREDGQGLIGHRNGDYIPSLVGTDEGYQTKAPGVVARLMGLDCLPTPALSEPDSTPFCGPPFALNSCPQGGSSNFQFNYHNVNKTPSMKVQNQAVERFQREMLPPKSAKPIPIAHQHRLLSPIKNPGFIPTNNLAYIVEASSKIMEQCPQSASKGKTLHFASSSTPLKIRDVRERMEAVERDSAHLQARRRPKEPVVNQKIGGPGRKKKYRGSTLSEINNGTLNAERELSGRSKDKGKLNSLPVQAKVTVQRKEQSYSSDSWRSANRKEADEVRNDQHIQKTVQKRNSVSRTSGVLKQNSQKQNCVSGGEKLPLKASVPIQQKRKSRPVNGSVRPVKDPSKAPSSEAGARKIHTMPKDSGKEMSSKTKTISEKKPTSCGNLSFEDPVGDNMVTLKDHNRQIKCNITQDGCSNWDLSFEDPVGDNMVTLKDHNRQIKCNITQDGCSNWDAGDRKSSTDVVSFTFTSPVKKTQTVTGPSEQLKESGITLHEDINDSPKVPNLHSPRSNVTGGDALSVLLEQKLKELTSRVESSHCDFDKAVCSASSFNVVRNSPKEDCIDFEINLRKARPSSYDVGSTSYHGRMLEANGMWKGLRDIDGQISCNRSSSHENERDPQCSSFTSTREPSSSGGSYDSTDPNSIFITKGDKQYHLVEPHYMNNCFSNRMSQSLEVDLEFSDSASSSVAGMSGSCNSPIISLNDFKRSANWELEYITRILFSSDLTLDDLVLGQVNKVLNPNLFDYLENSQTVSAENAEEYFKLERKVLFDCVGDCLALRGEQLLGGRNCKEISKWGVFFSRKIFLAEDLCKEISTWTSLEDLMVDELVEKDMSYGKGKWVDFGNEIFEECIDVEKAILSSLMDELVEALW